jgi:serine/threonine protein kinase/predicted Zn-dependent protease
VTARLRADQQQRWQRGERVRVATYLEHLPELRGDDEMLLDLVYGEIVLRRQLGQMPQLEEYLPLLPRCARQLASRFAFPTESATKMLPGADAPARDRTSPSATEQATVKSRDPGVPPPPGPTDQARTVPLPGDPQATRPQRSAEQARSGSRQVEAAAGVRPNLAGFEILGELGRGGMGVVYWVRQARLNRTAALKMLLAGMHAGPEERARFRTEAEAVARLQHPNIVQVYEVGEHEDRPYQVLEYVDGGSLAKKLEGTPLPAGQAAALAEALARAMHYAHQRGVVHRDLKPANVLLARTDPSQGVPLGAGSEEVVHYQPKITDFGLAKLVGGGGDGQTQTGAIMGTPSYMAPEQAAGRAREVGPASDVYALGAILYALLTGLPPFRGTTVLDTLKQVQGHEPVPPTRLGLNVPRDVETICLKCLAKEPGKRYASAEELAEDLRRFRTGEPIQARPTPRWERAWKWARRRPAAAALLGVSCAAALSLFLLTLWHNAHLQTSLANALAQVRDANLVRVQAQWEAVFQAGQEAAEKDDLQTAKIRLSEALAHIRAEPGLADLRRRTEDLLVQVNHRQDARANYQRFLDRRDDALYHGTLFTGVDLSANLEATRTAACEALALFGMTSAAASPLSLPETYLSEREKATITTGCYELLLILAEATAYPLPGDGPDDRRRRAREALPHLDQAAALGLTTKAYHLRRSQYLSELGDHAGAASESRRAQAVQPALAADYFLLGDQAYKAGNLDEALEKFHQAMRVEPGHFWAQYFVAVCYLKMDRPQEAVPGLTACLFHRPNFLWPHLLRGYAYGQLGNFVAADADFDAAIRLNAAEYGIYVNRGAMRLRQDRLTEAMDDCRHAITLKPQQYQPYLNLAEVYRRQQDYANALAQLDEAIRLAPAVANGYWLRALVRRECKAPAAALRDLEQAIRLAASGGKVPAEYHFERGRLLHEAKDYDAALAAYDAALKVDPDHGLGQRLRADVLLALGRGRDALAALDRYLSADRADAEAYRLRGFERAKIGDHAGALADYTRSLELEPGAPATRTRRGWAYLMEAARLAEADFEAAIQADPAHGEFYNGRGYARVLLGQHRAGIADAEEALRLGPGRPELRERLALSYNAACVYAQAAGQAGAAAREPGQQEAVRKYEDRALELLRQCLDLLPVPQREPYVRQALSDPAFGPLRHSPAFRELVAEYSRPTQ